MKQIRFKHLATLGVCCSLFSNSLAGVTAVAETMTSESSPTAASHEQTASTKESAETEVKETQASENRETPTVESQEKTDASADVVEEKKKVSEEMPESETTPVLPQPMPLSGVGVKADNLETLHQQLYTLLYGVSRVGNYNFPEGKLQFNVKSDDNTSLNLSDFTFDAQIFYQYGATGTNGTTSVVNPVTNQGTDNFNIIIPAKTLTAAAGKYQIYNVRNIGIRTPKYIADMKMIDDPHTIIGSTGMSTAPPTYLAPKVEKVEYPATVAYSAMYTISLARQDLARDTENYFYMYSIHTNQNGTSAAATAHVPTTYPTLQVRHKKVTESFKNQAGAPIPPPPNFEEGRKTSITNNDFTFTQSGTLPKSYKGADGKTYFLKGWYKGKTKPSTLRTDAPSYKVTYDDNDDLTVVYEEPVTRVVTVPAVTYQFGFVTEKGTYDYGAKVTGNATEVANDEKTTVAPLTSTAKGIYQEITVPTRRLSYHDRLSSFYGVTDFNLKIPKYYKTPTVKPGSYFTGPADGYPTATVTNRNLITNGVLSSATTGADFALIPKTALGPGNYTMATTTATNDATKTPFARALSQAQATSTATTYKTTSEPILYFLENRRINARYVDQDGNKLTSLPPDVKQDAKTPITSENFTFMHGTTLPDSYKGTDGKTYKFKGWYRGKSKPNTLQTTKQPSYQATFDDNDDLTVVYEVTQDTWIYPGFYAEFVDEKGQAFEDSLTFSGNYTQYLRRATDATLVTAGSMIPMAGTKTTLKNNQYKIGTQTRVAMPADFDSQANANYDLRGYTISDITITNDLKYVDKIEATNTEIPIASYPVGLVGVEPVFNNGTPTFLNELDKGFKKGTDNKFAIKATFGANSSNATYPRLLRVGSTSELAQRRMVLTGFDGTPEYKQTMNYKVTRKKVTEKFVNPAGAPINPPTGYTQNKQTPMTSNTFTFTQAGTLPASYKGQDGKTYIFKGWYKGKTKPSTLKTTKTPSYPVTFDGNDDLNVVYEEGVASIDASLKGVATIIPSGGNQLWNMTIKNTGTAPLTGLKVTPTANWSKGLEAPIYISFRIAGTTISKNIPVTAETWAKGIALEEELLAGQSATVRISTVGTGAPLEVLQAELNVTSNAPTATVSSTVRIQGTDQEVTDPVGEGFISLPTFDFGQVGIAGATTQHGLKKAADYYGNGTRNPFVRIKKSQPNWSLTAQLSQPKSAKDSLPTATRLLLGQAAVSKVDNYNLVTEMLNPVGTTSALSLTANNAVTNVITDKQFTGNDVYNLDFNFNNVKLEVPANQGTKGEQYNATVTWNLVTGP